MNLGQVHHIEYYVNDLKKTKEFWSWFFPKIDYSAYQDFDDGFSFVHSSGTYIVFVQVSKEHLSHDNNRQASGLNHIAFQGAKESDLENLLSQLVEKGIKIIKQYKGYLCFEEVSGICVEIYGEK